MKALSRLFLALALLIGSLPAPTDARIHGGATVPGAPIAIPVPAGFGYTPNFTISWNGSTYTTDFDPTTLRPTTQLLVYACQCGNNNNDASASDAAHAVRSIRLAQAIANAAVTASSGSITGYAVEVVAGTYRQSNTQARSGQPTLNGTYADDMSSVNPNANEVIEGYGGNAISMADVALPAYVASGFTNIYVSTYTTQSPSATVIDTSNLDQYGKPTRMAKVLSVANPADPSAEINATWAQFPGMGAVWQDSANSKVWVRTFNNRAPDSAVIDINGANRVRYPTVAQATLYINNFQEWGGANPGTSLAGPNYFVAVDSAFLYGANGISFQSDTNSFVYFVRVNGSYGEDDGLNYHGLTGSTSALTGPKVVEINCVANWNGFGGGGLNNGSTIHEYVQIIRINGDYRNNADRSIHDVQHAQSWNLNSLSGPSFNPAASPQGNWVAGEADGDSTQMWIDRGVSEPGSTYDLYAYGGSSIFYANPVSGIPGNTGGAGTITTYSPPA